MNRFVALFVALVAGVGVAVWYYRVPNAGAGGGGVPIVRNDDRWLDDLQSRTPRDVEAATEQLEQRGTAALPLSAASQDPPPRRASEGRAQSGGDPRTARRKRSRCRGRLVIPILSGRRRAHLHCPRLPSRGGFDSDEARPPRRLRSLGKLRERASIDPQIVIPILLTGLDDVDVQVRTVAVTYLGIVRDDPDKAVRGLIKALSDEEAEVRQTAAVALAAYGPLAERAIPALKKAANDPDEDVRAKPAAPRTIAKQRIANPESDRDPHPTPRIPLAEAMRDRDRGYAMSDSGSALAIGSAIGVVGERPTDRSGSSHGRGWDVKLSRGLKRRALQSSVWT